MLMHSAGLILFCPITPMVSDSDEPTHKPCATPTASLFQFDALVSRVMQKSRWRDPTKGGGKTILKRGLYTLGVHPKPLEGT